MILILEREKIHAEIFLGLLQFLQKYNIDFEISIANQGQRNILDYIELFNIKPIKKNNDNKKIFDLIILGTPSVLNHRHKFKVKEYKNHLVFNHRGTKTKFPSIFLGKIPYNKFIYKKNFWREKHLIPNYFIPKNIADFKNNYFLQIGTILDKNWEFLEDLKNSDYTIDIINRNFEYPNFFNKNILVNKKEVNWEELLSKLLKTKFILNLFKDDSIYHNKGISGIIPYAISLGIPFLCDEKYYISTGFDFLDKNLVYKNTKDDFKRAFKYSCKMSYQDWKEQQQKIIDFRDKVIKNNEKKWKNLLSRFLNIVL